MEIEQPKNILIRLPNWLGDMVMATAFVKAVRQQYPDAAIDFIAKSGIDFLLDYFPVEGERYLFSRDKYKGIAGAWKFGREISKKKYDILFCLPDSFSSGLMAYAIGAKKRIGYKKEFRSFLFTYTYHKKKYIHRAEQYIDLLQQYLKQKIVAPTVNLKNNAAEKNNAVIININSEASSRRLPDQKAISIINHIRKNIQERIILIGSSKEEEFVNNVFNALDNKNNIINLAGKTSIKDMIALFGACKLLLTTDSGPAHVANALKVHTVVLFGAGNENITAPYNKDELTVIRLGKLKCEPCGDNICKVYGVPECLLQLDENIILYAIQSILNRIK